MKAELSIFKETNAFVYLMVGMQIMICCHGRLRADACVIHMFGRRVASPHAQYAPCDIITISCESVQMHYDFSELH